MPPVLPTLWFSKLGPIRNEILVYFTITGLILLYTGKKMDPPFRYLLMSGGMILFFTGPGFWLYATLKLQSSPQEQDLLKNIRDIVEHDKELRKKERDNDDQTE